MIVAHEQRQYSRRLLEFVVEKNKAPLVGHECRAMHFRESKGYFSETGMCGRRGMVCILQNLVRWKLADILGQSWTLGS